MIVTLIQGITIFILLVMIIKHLKPVVEKLTLFQGKELRGAITDYDDEVELSSKNFHKTEVSKDSKRLFTNKNPTFGSIYIETRVRSTSRKNDGIPDLGTYDCPTAKKISDNKGKTLEQCGELCKNDDNCLGFRWSRDKKCMLSSGTEYKIHSSINNETIKSSKCLIKDKVYVYDDLNQLNTKWKTDKYIYYPKLKNKSGKKIDCFDNKYNSNCSNRTCHRMADAEFEGCKEQGKL
jgi:hypothetical protein